LQNEQLAFSSTLQTKQARIVILHLTSQFTLNTCVNKTMSKMINCETRTNRNFSNSNVSYGCYFLLLLLFNL